MNRNGKRIRTGLLAVVMTAALIVPVLGSYENTHVNTGRQSEDIVKVSLTQLGYTEGTNNLTKFGQWYETVLKSRNESSAGFANGAWCAMYTSWCANQAGIKETTVPYYALCADGVDAFKKKGLWKEPSGYTPKPGDLVFFDWNVNNYADHTGIVMYAEDGILFSIEGNTTANRLDGETSSTNTTVPDFCLIRQRELKDKYILGYATPRYTGTAFASSEYEGIIDLEAGQKKSCRMALDDDVMDPTGSYTFGPYYGMTRGEFADYLCRAFGLTAEISGISAFSDVSATHDYYRPVMTLKKLGLTSGVGNNQYKPDVYISVTETKFMLSAVCRYVGLDIPSYGYVGDPKGKYLRRFEAAELYAEIAENSVALATAEKLTVTNTAGTDTEVPGIALRGDAYIRLSDWNTILAGTDEQDMTASGGSVGTNTRCVVKGSYTVSGRGTQTARQINYQEEAYFNIADLAGAIGLLSAAGSDTHFTLLKSGVTIANNIHTAALHDYSGLLKDEELYTPGSYSVTATVPSGQKTVQVEVRADSVKSFTNAQGEKGYWTGFAVTAPSNAVSVRVSRDGNASGLKQGVITEQADGMDRGLVVLYDLRSASATEPLMIQWLGESGNVVGQTSYQVDLSGALIEGNYVAPFTDVPKTAWYAEAVRYVKNYGIMDGTSATTFGATIRVTRGMVAQMIYAMEGKPKVTYKTVFSDVQESDWYAQAVCWASEKGVVSGYTGGKYGPKDNVTREQLVAILHKYAIYRGGDVSARGDLSRFTDTARISSWATEPVQWAVASGLLSGRDTGALDPKGSAVRSEVAQIFMKFHKKYIAAS